MERVIQHTGDGTNTLFVPEIDEHYHSTKGARTESQHVYINMGMKSVGKTPLNILEIGFGTGLDAYLTLLAARDTKQEVHYTGLELYPLAWDAVKELHYTDNPLFEKIHASQWEEEAEITPGFFLRKLKADFTTWHHAGNQAFDIIYFDAFAPEKQPEMWEKPLFDNLYAMLNPGGVLTTYCAKGIIRRMLQQSGFRVERLQGPPGGKREILRATKRIQ